MLICSVWGLCCVSVISPLLSSCNIPSMAASLIPASTNQTNSTIWEGEEVLVLVWVVAPSPMEMGLLGTGWEALEKQRSDVEVRMGLDRTESSRGDFAALIGKLMCGNLTEKSI